MSVLLGGDSIQVIPYGSKNARTCGTLLVRATVVRHHIALLPTCLHAGPELSVTPHHHTYRVHPRAVLTGDNGSIDALDEVELAQYTLTV